MAFQVWSNYKCHQLEVQGESFLHAPQTRTGQMVSLGVPRSWIIRSICWISDEPGNKGLWASSSARIQPTALHGRDDITTNINGWLPVVRREYRRPPRLLTSSSGRMFALYTRVHACQLTTYQWLSSVLYFQKAARVHDT